MNIVSITGGVITGLILGRIANDAGAKIGGRILGPFYKEALPRMLLSGLGSLGAGSALVKVFDGDNSEFSEAAKLAILVTTVFYSTKIPSKFYKEDMYKFGFRIVFGMGVGALATISVGPTTGVILAGIASLMIGPDEQKQPIQPQPR